MIAFFNGDTTAFDTPFVLFEINTPFCQIGIPDSVINKEVLEGSIPKVGTEILPTADGGTLVAIENVIVAHSGP